MQFRADLHTHTTSSDGTFTPKELIAKAAEIGLSGLAITDHDTVDAYEQAIPLAKEAGLRLLTGIELSSRDESGEPIHILGYDIDVNSEPLHHFCDRHVVRRNERNSKIIELLTKADMPITEQEMIEACGDAHKRVYGRPHIARVMMDKGYVRDVKEAFNKWIGEGRPCFALSCDMTPLETIEMIHTAGGKAVIAHPHFIRRHRVLKKLLRMDFDGIEGYYAKFPPAVEQRWVQIGRDRGWIVTGGSDFHGEIKPQNPLGCSWVDEETFNQLQRS